MLGSLCKVTNEIGYVILDLNSDCMFFLHRALLTKCVVEGEVGKILSLLALMQAFMPTVGITTMRVVYNATVDDFAGAFYLVASGVRTVCMFIIFFVWTQRRNLMFDRHGTPINRG